MFWLKDENTSKLKFTRELVNKFGVWLDPCQDIPIQREQLKILKEFTLVQVRKKILGIFQGL